MRAGRSLSHAETGFRDVGDIYNSLKNDDFHTTFGIDFNALALSWLQPAVASVALYLLLLSFAQGFVREVVHLLGGPRKWTIHNKQATTPQ